MRYFIQSNNVGDVLARRAYIEEVTHLYFFQQHNVVQDYIVLQSFPLTTLPDICLIYGHNYSVAKLLEDEEIYEKNIFIISCLKWLGKHLTVKGKNIYIAPQKDSLVNLRFGEAYGFGFEISDAELNVYNSPYKTIMDKFTFGFQKVQNA